MTVRASLTNHFDHGGGGGGPAGSEGPAHRTVTSVGKLPMGGLPSTAGIVLLLSPGLRGLIRGWWGRALYAVQLHYTGGVLGRQGLLPFPSPGHLGGDEGRAAKYRSTYILPRQSNNKLQSSIMLRIDKRS